ncbi:MAG: hypothetical protein ABH870_00905 [bacterium]
MPVVQFSVPQDIMKQISLTDTATLEEIFTLGLMQKRINSALTLYQIGRMSIGYAAERFSIPKEELIKYAKLRGIEPEFDNELVGSVK